LDLSNRSREHAARSLHRSPLREPLRFALRGELDAQRANLNDDVLERDVHGEGLLRPSDHAMFFQRRNTGERVQP
jgi:hypothetical protein